jgi:alpha-2-macroglobulin
VKNSIRFIRQFLKPWRFVLLALLMVIAIAIGHSLQIEPSFSATPADSVAPTPNPELPGWIEQVSPTGKAKPLSQIRIRFKDPLIPLEQLESDTQQKILQQFELSPVLPGKFRFLTPRMVGFQADQALPNATQFRVILKAGLTDLKQHQLSQDFAWTFQTEPIQILNLPGSPEENSSVEFDPIDVRPALEITTNTELLLSSLTQSASLISQNTQQRVALRVVLKSPPPDRIPDLSQYIDPNEAFTIGRQWHYVLIPRKTLDSETQYRLEILPGLRSTHGNLVSEQTFKSYVKTYGPLSYQKLTFDRGPYEGSGYGRFIEGSPLLNFNNGLEYDSIAANLAISPTPNKVEPLFRLAGDRIIGLNPWIFEPHQTYTLTLRANLKDKYGQILGKSITIIYRPGDIAPDLSVPTGFRILPIDASLTLNFSAMNLPEREYQASYRVLQPKDLLYADFNSHSVERISSFLLPKPETWEHFKVSDAKVNQLKKIAIPPKEKLGDTSGLLAYGITAHTQRYREDNQEKWRDATQYGLVQFTNLGIFAQRFPQGGFVRVHHLNDGSAAPATTIEVYPSFANISTQGQQQVDRPCMTGITDQTGTLTLDPAALQQCLQGRDSVLVIAREKQDWAFVHFGDDSYRYHNGISWTGSDLQPCGTIFSDRKLYKPGETVWLTGMAYYLKKGVLQQDKQVRYRLTLFDPEGQGRDLGYQITNEFGTFAVKVDLSAEQPSGHYRLTADAPTNVQISGDFNVEDFKLPNFKVDLSLDQAFVTPNKTVTATVQSRYLFGNPVSGGKANFSIRRQPINFTPKGWEEFSFGQRSFWPEEQPFSDRLVRNEGLDSSTALDAQGQGKQIVKVADDLPLAMTYQVNAEIKDSANTVVTDTKTFTALPSDRLIGLQNDFGAESGKPFPVKVIVTNPSGQAIAGERVQVELQKMEYSKQQKPGDWEPKNAVTYTTVAKTEVASAISTQSAPITALKPGAYRIRANFVSAPNDRTATDQQIWVTGSESVPWGEAEGNNYHKINLNQTTYQPGDTATITIQSPYPEAKLYLSVVRHKVLYQNTLIVHGSAPQVQIPITSEMVPNAAVQTVLIRQGVPLSEVEPGQIKDLVSIGFSPFDLTLKEKILNVAISPAQPTVAPQGTQTVDLTLQDVQGKPVSGQFTVIVANESVLQLTGYRAPNLVDAVYAHRMILTYFKDNRRGVVLEPWEPIKSWILGTPVPAPVRGLDGDGRSAFQFAPDADATQIRRNFKALAYYNSSVLTDDQGRARISFTIPDDLTTWRIMAVAVDRNFRFGTNDATFLAAKPLMANPVLPQFARPGDHFQAGLSVTPPPNPKSALTVDGSLSGAATFTSPAKLQTTAPTATQTYRFPIAAIQPGTAEVQFSAKLGEHTDAFAVPLTIKPHVVTEQVVETGTTTAQAKIPLNLGDRVEPNEGGLDISLSSTLIPTLTASAKQVLGEEQLPFLEPAASQLAIAAHLKTLSRQYPQSFTDFDPDAQANIALKHLQALRYANGGFAAQPKQENRPFGSDSRMSPYAIQSLVLAQKAGISVNPLLLKDATSYLNQLLANPAPDDLCNERLCTAKIHLQALLALADLGDLRPNAIAKIYAVQDQLDVAAQIKLAGYLSRLPNRQAEATALSEKLQEILNQSGQSAVLNLSQQEKWFSSPTVAQAEMLRLQIARQTSAELQDRTLRGLLALRRDGTWGSTYDNAQALAALVAYSQQQPTPPNFQAIAQLAGKTILSQIFTGYQQTSVNKTIPMQELPRGRHDLVLQKSGEGILHYLMAYRYQPQGVQPGRLNGLRVTHILRPINQNAKVQRIGLTPLPQPIALNAGELFEVGVEVITDHPVDHLVITDPLPAGLEAVDTTFQTNSAYFQSRGDSWQLNYQKVYKDRVVACGDRLDAGVYVMNYLVRAVTPGVFQWPGVEAHLQYTPEEFGRSSSAMLQVSDQENDGVSLPQS